MNLPMQRTGTIRSDTSYSEGKKVPVESAVNKSSRLLDEEIHQALRLDSIYKKLPAGITISKVDMLERYAPGEVVYVQHQDDQIIWEDRPAPRTFDTGATRDKDETKLDFEGFLSPRVIKAFAEYMHKNREMEDGSTRASDNWQKGIPFDSYMKSGWRHFFDWWAEHRGLYSRDGLTDALCGLLFNVSGYLHEHLKRMENENKNI